MTTRFYTVASLSPKRHMTPEGFLICEDVPVARIGEQIYGPDETPIQPNRPRLCTHLARAGRSVPSRNAGQRAGESRSFAITPIRLRSRLRHFAS